MIVYNETLIVEEASYPDWLQYMREVHIPGIMATGLFDSYRVLSVIDSPNEGVTTCIQYNTDNEERFALFYNQHLQAFHIAHNDIYEGKFVMYNTTMESIDEG
jgi:hypothetical protein